MLVKTLFYSKYIKERCDLRKDCIVKFKNTWKFDKNTLTHPYVIKESLIRVLRRSVPTLEIFIRDFLTKLSSFSVKGTTRRVVVRRILFQESWTFRIQTNISHGLHSAIVNMRFRLPLTVFRRNSSTWPYIYPCFYLQLEMTMYLNINVQEHETKTERKGKLEM